MNLLKSRRVKENLNKHASVVAMVGFKTKLTSIIAELYDANTINVLL